MNRTEALNRTKDFWDSFYTKKRTQKITYPSPFALWTIDGYLGKDDIVLEIGCGDGRDSFVLVENVKRVVAIDGCKVAISNNKQRIEASSKNISFIAMDFANIDQLDIKYNICYSRFVLHAIPEPLEDRVLKHIYNALPKGGKMIHEFRTNHDKLMQKGELLSSNERLTDHYRRFIDTTSFRKKLFKLGFKELYFIESNGLALYKDENPVVARIVVEKL
jgi:ubiquinone/menaquinone biosynthesis C-methylase UbiE